MDPGFERQDRFLLVISSKQGYRRAGFNHVLCTVSNPDFELEHSVQRFDLPWAESRAHRGGEHGQLAHLL